MTYQKAANIILNTWNSMQNWDEPSYPRIIGETPFDIAMKMAYDTLMEKENEKEPTIKVETNMFNKSTIYTNCTVEVWENTVTGETSIGWYRTEETEEICTS